MISPVMHARVKFHLDQQNSARFTKTTIDTSLNVEQDKFINVGVDTIGLDQYTADYMRPLVKLAAAVTVVSNVIAYPADYRGMLGLTLTIDGVTKYWTRKMLYSEKGPDFENSFTAPDPSHPAAIESSAGLTIFCGTGTVSAATMDYVMMQTDILYSTTAITAGPAVLTVGLVYYVFAATVFHNSIQYAVGQSFTAVNTAFGGTGTVYLIQNSQLGPGCHEELCKAAAAELSGITGDVERFKIKGMESKR